MSLGSKLIGGDFEEAHLRCFEERSFEEEEVETFLYVNDGGDFFFFEEGGGGGAGFRLRGGEELAFLFCFLSIFFFVFSVGVGFEAFFGGSFFTSLGGGFLVTFALASSSGAFEREVFEEVFFAATLVAAALFDAFVDAAFERELFEREVAFRKEIFFEEVLVDAALFDAFVDAAFKSEVAFRK